MKDVKAVAGKVMEQVKRQNPDLVIDHSKHPRPLNELDNACVPNCMTCEGKGWVTADVPVSDYRFGKLYPCPDLPITSPHYNKCGLTPEQREYYRWEILRPRADERANKALNEAIDAVKQAMANKRGFIYLYGTHGLAKSEILKIAVAETIRTRRMVMPRYDYMYKIIDRMKESFNASDGDKSLSDIEREYALYPVLCIDEFENGETLWSDRRRFYLLEQRYIRAIENGEKILTIIASNTNVSDITEARLRDRIMDGRCKAIELVGDSVRPALPLPPRKGAA